MTALTSPKPLCAGSDADGAAELIGHILTRYHATHLAELPPVIALARRVETVHRSHPACPLGLADHLEDILADLEQHQHKEEAVLFPAMLQGGHPMLAFPIARMQADHRSLEADLSVLAAFADGFSPPEGACGTWRALYAACRKLHDDLVEHMRLENEVLFPRFAP